MSSCRGMEYREAVTGDGANYSPENFRNKV